ncbi:MAG: Hint domain-containing protein [Paraclostridium sp.]
MKYNLLVKYNASVTTITDKRVGYYGHINDYSGVDLQSSNYQRYNGFIVADRDNVNVMIKVKFESMSPLKSKIMLNPTVAFLGSLKSPDFKGDDIYSFPTTETNKLYIYNFTINKGDTFDIIMMENDGSPGTYPTKISSVEVWCEYEDTCDAVSGELAFLDTELREISSHAQYLNDKLCAVLRSKGKYDLISTPNLNYLIYKVRELDGMSADIALLSDAYMGVGSLILSTCNPQDSSNEYGRKETKPLSNTMFEIDRLSIPTKGDFKLKVGSSTQSYLSSKLYVNGSLSEEMNYSYNQTGSGSVVSKKTYKETDFLELKVSRLQCLAKGTKITLANGDLKNIEDVLYTDILKVWSFDISDFDSAKPLWIKKVETTNQYNLLRFSDGSELKTIDQHRIFNKQKGMFTYPMTDETPIGTLTFNSKGEYVTLVSKEVVDESVDYYNIITDYHINLFANGILTSCRYNNIYPIKDMTFVKENITINDNVYESDIQKYVRGLRVLENTFTPNDNINYINKLMEKEMG